MYQRVGKAAYKVDLSNIHLLLKHLLNPHEGFKTIHVAGTNGKGSTSHMLASVLQEAGYKVGLYTSPHLKDFRERIKINGKMIAKRSVSTFINEHKPFFEEQQLSFFEMTVGLAFDYFNTEKVDIAIVEVGLGGRLDSTNVIIPEVSVITNIGIDHTQFLGNTIAEIAKEKAGIIKLKIPVVIGESTSETKNIFQQIAKQNKSTITFAEDLVQTSYKTDLLGDYQKKNIQTVVVTIEVLKTKGFTVLDTHIKQGLLHTIKNTGFFGRWQVLQKQPKVICDTAHNKEGLTGVMQQLQQENFETLHLVLGVVNDKNLGSILPLFPENAVYYFCKPDILRGMDASVLKEKCKEYNLKGQLFGSVKEAYNKAKNQAKKEDLIFVGGSTFVVAEIL